MWKYLDLLNANIAILLTIGCGAAAILLHIFRPADARIFSLFLFKFTLAASVIEGLGIKTDLYDGSTWRFIGAFLVMRAIMLLACTAFVGGLARQSLGAVTANWMVTTWISTVVLGTPLLRALYGPKYANLGVVAGVSSFIFQLPVMLVLFEVDAWRQERHGALPQAAAAPQPSSGTFSPVETEGREAPDVMPDDLGLGQVLHEQQSQDSIPATAPAPAPASSAAKAPAVSAAGMPALGMAPPLSSRPTHAVWGGQQGFLSGWRMSRAQAKRMGHRLLANHVLWGVAIGLILSLSTLGPKYMDPGNPPAAPNCRFVAGLGWIFATLDYFARCTEPVALFATGMWAVHKRPLAAGLVRAVLYMAVKLVLVPLLMVGCAAMLGLSGVLARAAVLVASLPVSSAAFVLCTTYDVAQDLAVTNVFIGNLLILPTTIAWMAAMDGVGLWEVPTVGTVPVPGCT